MTTSHQRSILKIQKTVEVLGLLFSDSDSLVKGMDPILLSSSKNSKKNLDSFCFVISFLILSVKNDVNVPSKSNKQKTFF
jgi:hypothetical protein